jgi:hypothetical protein
VHTASKLLLPKNRNNLLTHQPSVAQKPATILNFSSGGKIEKCAVIKTMGQSPFFALSSGAHCNLAAFDQKQEFSADQSAFSGQKTS